jgi:hypothetical protein
MLAAGNFQACLSPGEKKQQPRGLVFVALTASLACLAARKKSQPRAMG